MNKTLTVIFTTGLLFGAQSVQAHCDAFDGPVAKAAQKALENGNVNPVLAYAPAATETEIRAALTNRARYEFWAARRAHSRIKRSWKLSYTAPAKALAEQIEHASSERLAHVQELQKAPPGAQDSG